MKRGTTIKGSENITLFRLITLKHALKLETLGMKKRGKSAYAIVKEEFNLKGNKQKVIEQLEIIIKESK
jgi:hypothetical protein